MSDNLSGKAESERAARLAAGNRQAGIVNARKADAGRSRGVPAIGDTASCAGEPPPDLGRAALGARPAPVVCSDHFPASLRGGST